MKTIILIKGDDKKTDKNYMVLFAKLDRHNSGGNKVQCVKEYRTDDGYAVVLNRFLAPAVIEFLQSKPNDFAILS